MASNPSPIQVSKWVKIPLLVDVDEMRDLLMHHLPPFRIYDVQKVTTPETGIEDPEYFLEGYSRYIASLKNGEIPLTPEFRSLFSAAWSVTGDSFFSLPTQDGRRLLKVVLPVVQTQLNQIRYAPEEKVFRTQVFGPDTICWGIQLGFPHLFLDPLTYEAKTTREFPNMALFSAIQKWVRAKTVPTPFLVEGEKINSPIRLGKGCFSWISSHPQLIAAGIKIDRT